MHCTSVAPWSYLELYPCFLVLEAELKTLAKETGCQGRTVFYASMTSWSQLQLCPCFLVLGAELQTLARQRLVVMDALYFLRQSMTPWSQLELCPCLLVLGAQLNAR